MKIQLSVSEDYYDEIAERLLAAQFEIDDDGQFILSEKERFISVLTAKDDRGEKVRINADDIVYIESLGHNVVIHTSDKRSYSLSERLYQLELKLDNMKFIRVSNCAIIAKSHIQRIKPSLSMKFVLNMTDGALVDVTRTYYSSFKKFMGI